KLKSWEEIHSRYDKLWLKYPLDKQKHAFAVLSELYETDKLTLSQWKTALDKAVRIQEFISDQVYATRKKDYDNTFRQATYRNMDEMTAAIGTVEDNSFIVQVRKETEKFRKMLKEIKKREEK
ncbi:MAG: DUF4954 family protein, partial [Bacteroidales bacterium]|nr:DUF4954 family protein [Bacteroidales bacterium]